MKKTISMFLLVVTLLSISILSVGCGLKDKINNLFDKTESFVEDIVISNESNSNEEEIYFNPDDPNLAHFKRLEVGDNISNKTIYIETLSDDAYEYLALDKSPQILFFNAEVFDSNDYEIKNNYYISFYVNEAKATLFAQWGNGSNFNEEELNFTRKFSSVNIVLAISSAFIVTSVSTSSPVYVKFKYESAP